MCYYCLRETKVENKNIDNIEMATPSVSNEKEGEFDEDDDSSSFCEVPIFFCFFF